MRTRSLALLLAGVSAALVSGQSKLPPDINPTSYSRLPPLDRAALDDDGKRVWDYVAGERGRGHAASNHETTLHRELDPGCSHVTS